MTQDEKRDPYRVDLMSARMHDAMRSDLPEAFDPLFPQTAINSRSSKLWLATKFWLTAGVVIIAALTLSLLGIFGWFAYMLATWPGADWLDLVLAMISGIVVLFNAPLAVVVAIHIINKIWED